ncbi:DNA mismatch repair endonuclease MutL [Lentibacillus sediminis]|uniref:DNA mismatch repair endonuclease MutL n=1 Tax=Lentibacillus sediminis TaxID=1940529 RepID=UPI000C1BCC60|nr:DNA mismatch repair endonuclease MutL [Lentibacillus sediminis]
MEITQMPEALANKIAAGEVVERPASVVKELVENSIDADSTWIKVELAEAGLQQIRVTDNGNGMSEDDCEKAFLPHATSKIKNENDLFHVQTLGFRGEALASIASVSRLTIKTSKGDAAGTHLVLEGGKPKSKGKSDARKGTEILVEDLFFNTPARLKYMKSLHTELGHITDLLNRLALSHPDIRLEAIHNGKGLFSSPGTGDLLQVIAHVYGMGTAKKMLKIKRESLDFILEGYIAKPEVTRASRSFISMIINGRYIKSIPLSKAVMAGYHTLLPIGRSPIVVLSIQMDPFLVDVNVHPTKLEVRFSKEKELFSLIEEAIRDKFREITLIPEMQQKPPAKELTQQQSIAFDHLKPSFSRNAVDSNSVIHEPKHSFPVLEDQEAIEQKPARAAYQTTSEAASESTQATWKNAQATEERAQSTESSAQVTEETSPSERIPSMYPIGQLHGTYILAQNENGLYMVDQHAAQERIKYEFFKRKLGKTINEAQNLLLPMTFEFSRQEAIFIEQYREELEKVGLFFEEFGHQTYVIRSYPNWFPHGFEEEIIREMIDQVMMKEKVDVEAIREDAAILMACKRSIKANHSLNQEEMLRLLEDLRKTADPFTCPHGRPIIVHFSTYELEKMFKRVM